MGRHKDKSKETKSSRVEKVEFVIYSCLDMGFFLCMAVMDEVNTELLMMITANKSQPQARKFRVDRYSGTQVPLNFDSDAEQVTAWLTSKGFSKP